MAHTLLCGQRRYTMTAIVVPNNTNFLAAATDSLNFLPLPIQEVRPPMGIVIAQSLDSDGQHGRLRFTTERGVSIIAGYDKPVLYLSDSKIHSVEYAWVGEGDFIEEWLIPDVSYLATVEEQSR